MVLLAACSGDDPTPTPTVPPEAPVVSAPVSELCGTTGGTLRVGLEEAMVDLDPHTMSLGYEIFGAAQHVYSTLVDADESLAPVPDLATSWTISGDGLTYTFNLRQGVKFHNGRTLTAADVKFSLERIKSPEPAGPYDTNLASVASITAPNDSTVVLKLTKPDAALLSNLTNPVMAVVPSEVVSERGNLKEFMVGTGPFKFVQHVPGTRLELEANRDYYKQGLPCVDEMVMVVLNNPTARTAALLAGDIDLIDNVPSKDVSQLQSNPNVTVVGGPNLNYVSFSLNTKKPPLDNKLVRQALAYGINRQEVCDKAFDGLCRPLEGTNFVPPYWPGSDEVIYATDYAKAKDLLAQAGYPDGFDIDIHSTRGSFYRGPISSVAQAEWAKIGVNATLVTLEGAAGSKAWKDGDTWFYGIRWWGADFIDPDGGLSPQFRCDGSFNRSQYCSTELDGILDQAVAETDQATRKDLYLQAQRLIADDAVYIHLLALDRYQAMGAGVKGYIPFLNASNQTLEQTWLD